MNDGYLARLKLVEQQISVIQNDMQSMAKQFNGALNQFASSIQGIMKVHKMFNVYVDANLQELREKAGLTGALLTENLEAVQADATAKAEAEATSTNTPSAKPEGGVEL